MIGESFKNDTRGQTLFDFVIGVLLLMLVLIFVVMFIPNMLDPFASNTSASVIDSGTIATDLTYDVLRDEGEQPYVLDEDCTVSFFTGSTVGTCGLDVSDRRDLIGVSDRIDASVILYEPDGETIAYIDGHEMKYVTEDARDKQVLKSMRVVSINETKYELHVRVW